MDCKNSGCALGNLSVGFELAVFYGLDKFEVPPAEQEEVKALVESTRGDIVVG